MTVKLKYETGIATTIQFIALTLLNFISGVSTSAMQCINGSGSCAGDVALAIFYFIVITVLFGILWLAGFAAQDRRSRRIAQVLILAEGFVFLVGLYDFTKHRHSLIGSLVSLVEIITSVWIAWLALRLVLARGGRVRRHRIRH